MRGSDSGKDRARPTITSPAGDVMTKEVGVITGDLEIATRSTETGIIEVVVRYAEANEWYAVEGSPIKPGGSSGGSFELDELHERIVEHLTKPGKIVDGNEEPTSLMGFYP